MWDVFNPGYAFDLLWILDTKNIRFTRFHLEVSSSGLQDTVVGLQDEEEFIIGCLEQGPVSLDVLSIVGMPGLGKTTIARRIYQSPEIQYEYPTRIWVYVSQDFNKKDVFLSILKEVTSKDMSGMSSHELALIVHDFLEKRRFFLVLDDVWDRQHYIAILEALPKSHKGNKVLITSRFENISDCSDLADTTPMLILKHDGNFETIERMNPPRHPHKLRRLSDDESGELLRLEVFGKHNSCPRELLDLWRRIADAVQGVPLVIGIVGGILLGQLSKTQSMSALKNEWKELSEVLAISRYHESIHKYVELSYIRLPNELGNMFLYLRLFPEDYKIPVTTLIRLWIAEGFIQRKEGRSLEDIAEENLNCLIRRKLVLVDEMRSNGKVKACRVHDIVREFCITKGSELNLFQEITYPEEETFDPPISDLQMHHRICVHFHPFIFFASEPYIPDVRSFSCFHKNETILLPEYTSKIPGYTFRLLRVLDIMPVRFTRFPLELTQLFCLRYIVLCGDFKKLPEDISMLRKIQTLIIRTSSRTLEIKADIWKMNQMRHLQTNASIVLRKEPENHCGQELQTLTNLSPDNCTSNVFDRARCLKKLGIRGTLSKLLAGETGSRKFDNLVMLNNLENLKLLNDVHMVSPSEGRLPCLPPPEKFPPRLKSLTLSATLLSWEHMSVLGMLEKLEVLKLKDNSFVGECWEVADDSFPSLQVLQIGYTNLASWKASLGCFPNLRSLALRNCEKLEALPKGLENSLSLREIELLRPSKAVVVSAKKIVEERQQIKLSIFFAPDE